MGRKKALGMNCRGGVGVHSDRWTCSPPHPLPRVERPGLGRPDKATGTSGGGGSVADVTVWLMLATNTLLLFA